MMFLRALNYFYITVHVESVNFMAFLGFQVYKIWADVWKIYCRQSLEIIFGQKSIPTVPFSDIILVFHMVCNNQDSNQESWESFSVGLLVTWLSNKPKNSSNYFFAFLSHYYGFTNYFETLTFLFLIPYWEEFQFVRTMYVKKYEAHKIIIYFSKKIFDVHKFNNLL